MELIDVIKTTKEKVYGIYNNYYNIIEDVKKLPKNKKIIMVGSGSSLNAIKLVISILNLEKEILYFYPNEFYNLEITNDNLIIFLSQSGSTKSINDYLINNKNNEVFKVSLTFNHNTQIAKNSNYHFEIGCGNEEYIFRTIGVTCSCLTLLIILNFYYKLNDIEFLKKDILTYINNLDYLIDISEKNYYSFIKKIKNKKMVFISGEKELFKLSDEISIKFSEMLPIFSNSYELEELIHGPQNSFNKESLIILLNKKGYDFNKFNSIKNFISNEIDKNSIYTISNEGNVDMLIELKTNKLNSLEFLIILQIFSYYAAKENNRNLNYPVYKNLNNYFQKQIKN